MIGIIGATNIIGKELTKFFIRDKRLNLKLTSDTGEQEIKYDNHSYNIEPLNLDFFKQLNFVFFCDNNAVKKWSLLALIYNVKCIDCTSEINTSNDIPMIIPNINGHIIEKCRFVASPCSESILLCSVLHPLLKISNIERIDVSVYQAVSETNEEFELYDQINKYNTDKFTKIDKKIFNSQILMNCFSSNSSIDKQTKYNNDEIKIIQETQKILNNNIKLSATCIKVPIVKSHSETIKIVFYKPITYDDIISIYSYYDDVKIINDIANNKFPEPIDVAGKKHIHIGRIRKDYCDDSGKTWHMFACGDQTLKGIVFNAYQIFSRMIK